MPGFAGNKPTDSSDTGVDSTAVATNVTVNIGGSDTTVDIHAYSYTHNSVAEKVLVAFDAGNGSFATALRGEFRVNTHTSGSQDYETGDDQIAALKDGGFIVTWTSSSQDGSGDGVYGQRFNADGTHASMTSYTGTDGNDTETLASASNLLVDLGDGTDSLTLGAGDDSIIVRNTENIHMGDGDDTVTIGSASLSQQVSTITLSGSVEDLYTVTVDGEEVTYRSQPNDTLSDVRAGLVGAVNAKTETSATVTASAGATGEELMLTAPSSGVNEFRINSHTNDDQENPTTAALPGGRFITTWQSYNQDAGGTDYGIYGQLHTADGGDAWDGVPGQHKTRLQPTGSVGNSAQERRLRRHLGVQLSGHDDQC